MNSRKKAQKAQKILKQKAVIIALRGLASRLKDLCPGGTTEGSLARSAWNDRLIVPSRRVRYEEITTPEIEDENNRIHTLSACHNRSHRSLRDGIALSLFPGTTYLATFILSLWDIPVRPGKLSFLTFAPFCGYSKPTPRL